MSPYPLENKMELYKISYSIGFRRREILCADYILALKIFIMICEICRVSNRYHQPRIYCMSEKGEWKEDEQREA